MYGNIQPVIQLDFNYRLFMIQKEGKIMKGKNHKNSSGTKGKPKQPTKAKKPSATQKCPDGAWTPLSIIRAGMAHAGNRSLAESRRTRSNQ